MKEILIIIRNILLFILFCFINYHTLEFLISHWLAVLAILIAIPMTIEIIKRDF